MYSGKIIVISAPSGTGKSTIINSILSKGDIDLKFSVSATNREPRQGETHGESYYFFDTDHFKKLISEDAFVEWEEVYEGRYYGTLKSEIERICNEGHNVILDIDVKGALNVKRIYSDRAVTIFIEPPSLSQLEERLIKRGTETPESLSQRLQKAEYELSLSNEFDKIVINDNLENAVTETRDIILNFIK